jgi:hypothetical protein
LRNHWTSEKYLAMIVPPLPFPGNEFLATPQICKTSQKPVDQQKIFGNDRASLPFPGNEFRGNASYLKRSQELIHTLLEKPVDQRKIFGTGRAAPQPSHPPEIDDPGS